MKFIHLYQSSYMSHSCCLVLKISFLKNVLFHIIFKVFNFILCVCLYCNFGMFFSLVFVCSQLWISVYSQFTKYDLIFIWLTVMANKFGKIYRAFTSNYFLSPKNNKKADLCMRFSSVTNASSSMLYLKTNISFFWCLLFFEDFPNPQD